MKEVGVRGERRWKKRRPGDERHERASHPGRAIHPAPTSWCPATPSPPCSGTRWRSAATPSGCARRSWASGAAGPGRRWARRWRRSPAAC
jgi:hypothetical protein